MISHCRAGGGLPIGSFSYFGNGDKGYEVTPIAIHSATRQEAKLEYPSLAGYKEAGGVQQVCFGNKNKEFTGLFEDLGLGEQFGKKGNEAGAQPQVKGK